MNQSQVNLMSGMKRYAFDIMILVRKVKFVNSQLKCQPGGSSVPSN